VRGSGRQGGGEGSAHPGDLRHDAETYGETLDRKMAWATVKAAQRRGMVGQTDDNLYFVRHSV
jgi:hypothetical protein